MKSDRVSELLFFVLDFLDRRATVDIARPAKYILLLYDYARAALVSSLGSSGGPNEQNAYVLCRM